MEGKVCLAANSSSARAYNLRKRQASGQRGKSRPSRKGLRGIWVEDNAGILNVLRAMRMI